jgi:predicted nucleic acid-binding Zn ribbon protein
MLNRLSVFLNQKEGTGFYETDYRLHQTGKAERSQTGVVQTRHS